MNLEDFVSATISSIISGVKEAQTIAEENGALVNPGGLMRTNENVASNSTWDNRTNNYSQPVAFDIAVTAEDSADGGGKIKVLGIEAGGEKNFRNVVESRVQFTVPVLFPSANVNDPEARAPKPSGVTIPPPIKARTRS